MIFSLVKNASTRISASHYTTRYLALLNGANFPTAKLEGKEFRPFTADGNQRIRTSQTEEELFGTPVPK